MGRTPLCRTKGGLNRGTWTTKEDTILLEYIRTHGEGGWTKLPQNAGLNRCGKSCRLRWLNYLRPDIKRGDISPDEDDLIIQMHNLLGNRWSLIAGRLPNRTDNEIKNYWNSHLSKKLAMNKSQQNKQILMTGSTIPSPLQNQVFKPTPVKITTADSRHSEKVRPNGCNGYGGNHDSYEAALKLPNAKETANLSKSEWCDLVVEKMITDDESERIALETADVNLVGTEVTNSTYPLSSLADQQSPHSHHFVVNLDQGLMDFNELSSPYCNLLFSPSNYSLPEFGLDEFYTEQASLTTETNEFEDICSDESNMLFQNPRLSKDSTISVD